jgi:hypothetical protein
VQFTAGARVRWCGDGRGFVLEGVDGGNGVLLWLRSSDSTVSGGYPVLARGDSTTPRGVAGAVRFMNQLTDRGVTLDSGLVTVSSTGEWLEAQARGAGLDTRAGQRVVLDASFGAVPLGFDTVDCRRQM